jgi:TRAP-type C4-dicarboxylate transport system permease small subunit
MSLLKFLDEHLEEYIVVACLGIMSVLIFVQVLMRYVFNNSLSWSEELARFLLIWIVNIGISCAIKKKTHVRITALDTVLPASMKRALGVITNLLVLAFAAIVMFLGYLVVEFNMKMGQMSQAMEFLPMWVIYLAVPIGFFPIFLSCVRTVQNMIEPDAPEENIIL